MTDPRTDSPHTGAPALPALPEDPIARARADSRAETLREVIALRRGGEPSLIPAQWVEELLEGSRPSQGHAVELGLQEAKVIVIHTGDPDAILAAFNEGFAEAMRQNGEPDDDDGAAMREYLAERDAEVRAHTIREAVAEIRAVAARNWNKHGTIANAADIIATKVEALAAVTNFALLVDAATRDAVIAGVREWEKQWGYLIHDTRWGARAAEELDELLQQAAPTESANLATEIADRDDVIARARDVWSTRRDLTTGAKYQLVRRILSGTDDTHTAEIDPTTTKSGASE
jgi:hypothetical protein